MSCMFRIFGEKLDIDALLVQCGLEPNRRWIKGEARSLKGEVHLNSGASFIVSNAEFDDFSAQLTDASAYLETHSQSIAKMTASPEVQVARFDFGIAITADDVCVFRVFPSLFIQLAAQAGISLEISCYACSDEEEEPN